MYNICTIFIGLALYVFSNVSQAAPDTFSRTFKIATDVQSNGTAGQLLEQFVQNVQQRTHGKLKFKIFHGGVLGGQLQYLQHIQRGVIDIGLINSASLESVIPEMGVLNMPYLFRNVEDYQKVMSNDAFRQALFELSKPHHFNFIGFISSDFRSIYSSIPISSEKDFNALRLRTISSPTYMQMLVHFGAIPTPIAFGELYAAIQQGVVDGAEGGIAGVYQAKFSDVAKYVLLTEHTRLTDFVISSDKFHRQLSKSERAIVDEEFAKISAISIQVAEHNELVSKQKLINEEGVTFYRPDKDPLIKAVAPMYQESLTNPKKSIILRAIYRIEDRKL